MASKKLKIGFDFDGVIAYNPLRVFRGPIMAVRHIFRKRPTDLEFPLPKNPQFKWLWALIHETSFFPSPGFSKLKQMLKDENIEAYVITGRYSFLDKSLHNWLKRHKIEHLFKRVYVNEKDQQPHHFKRDMIKKLQLDMFVEDNWDIVKYLQNISDHDKTVDTKVFWIYNLFDQYKHYPHKFPHLKGFLEYLSKSFEKK